MGLWLLWGIDIGTVLYGDVEGGSDIGMHIDIGLGIGVDIAIDMDMGIGGVVDMVFILILIRVWGMGIGMEMGSGIDVGIGLGIGTEMRRVVVLWILVLTLSLLGYCYVIIRNSRSYETPSRYGIIKETSGKLHEKTSFKLCDLMAKVGVQQGDSTSVILQFIEGIPWEGGIQTFL